MCEHFSGLCAREDHITSRQLLSCWLSAILVLVAAPLPLWAQATLENPQAGSFQSGIGFVSGWVCEAHRVEIIFEEYRTDTANAVPAAYVIPAAYGTPRNDTREPCQDDGNNGFGLLMNWNLLGDGEHRVRALADGVEFADVTVTVTTFGVESLQDAAGEFVLSDFPEVGTDVVVRWQEAQQNFVIIQVTGPDGPTDQDAQTATVSAVLDGDTIRLNNGQVVRYFGLNTPERGQPFADQATRYNEQLVLGKQVRVVAARPEPDSYQRLLAYVYADDRLVNARLISAGWAHVFILDPFDRAEEWLRLQRDAQAGDRGMWQAVEGPLKITLVRADAPGNDLDNPNGEYVRLCNVSPQPLDLTGFAVENAHNNRYVFPTGRLQPGYTALLLSGPGSTSVRNGEWRFHWGNGPVWNNSGDTAFLFDPSGKQIDSYTVQPSG